LSWTKDRKRLRTRRLLLVLLRRLRLRKKITRRISWRTLKWSQ
jgi:hypothetical protein